MLVMIAFAAAAAVPPPAPRVTVHAAPVCGPSGVKPVKAGADGSLKKLNELPNADLYLGVVRKDAAGCDKPAIVRFNIGSAPSGR